MPYSSTVAPSAWTAKIVQDFTVRPSRCTVHAPFGLDLSPLFGGVGADELVSG
jgi:hypothetical protein